MKRRRLWLLAPLAFIGFCGPCVVQDLRSPARRPDEVIRAEILAATPIGTQYAEAKEYINRRFDRASEMWPGGSERKVNVTHVVYGTYTEVQSFPLYECI